MVSKQTFGQISCSDTVPQEGHALLCTTEMDFHQREKEDVKELIKVQTVGNDAATRETSLVDSLEQQGQQASETLTCPLKVFLVSNSNRFYQMSMQIEGTNNLVIQVHMAAEQYKAIPVSHDLRSCTISSIDSPNGKFLCGSQRHYGLVLTTKQGNRKIYFLSYEQMQAGVDFLVCQGQQFASKAEQYKKVGSYPDQVMDDKSIVVHQISHEQLIMKFVGHDETEPTKLQAQAGLLALQKTSHWKETIDLVDHFMDSQGSSYIITEKPEYTLAEYIARVKAKRSISVRQIAILTKMIAKVIRKLVNERIMHRNICMENIIVWKKKDKKEKNTPQKT